MTMVRMMMSDDICARDGFVDNYNVDDDDTDKGIDILEMILIVLWTLLVIVSMVTLMII